MILLLKKILYNFVHFCAPSWSQSDSFLSSVGSLMTDIPARLGDLGRWGAIQSTFSVLGVNVGQVWDNFRTRG